MDILFETMDDLTRVQNGDGGGRLLTAPGVAFRTGPLYLRAVVEGTMGKAGFEDATIDCGDDAGLVLKALSVGWRRIVFSGDDVLRDKLTSIAARRQSVLLNTAG